MDSVQIIALITGTVFLLQVIYFTSKNKLQDKQAFLWIVLGIVGILIGIFLPSINQLVHYLGISYMPTFIYMIAFLVVLYLLVYQTTVISIQQEKVKNVIQELAFLNKKITELTKDREEGKK